MRTHPEAPVDCGFNCFVPIGHSFRIGLKHNGSIEWVVHAEVFVVKAIVGKNDFMFLDNDHNDSVLQFLGRKKISQDQIDGWSAYFEEIAERRAQLGFKYAFLLVPSKEYVYPEYYPFMREGVSPADQLPALFGDDPNFIYPLTELMRDRLLTFPKTDSHWTDFGAGVVARVVSDRLGVKFIDPHFKYDAIDEVGDLGNKFEPHRSEVVFRADMRTAMKHKVFDNEVHNRGWIRVFENIKGTGSCLIFGDSFSKSLVNHLTFTFRRLVHVFSGADIDWSIVEAERPDYLVSEITTRFTLRAPFKNFSVVSELQRKSFASDLSEKTRVIRAASSGGEALYLNLTSIAFHA